MSEISMELAQRVAPMVLEAAKMAAPKRTGAFAQGLTYEIIDGGDVLAIRIVSTVAKPKAIWIRDGTRPHTIVAYNARFLRFVPSSGGNVVFRRRVNHPGTRRDEKFFATMFAQKKMFADAMRSVGKEAVRGLIHW